MFMRFQVLVLDEADEMLNKGFREQIYDIYRCAAGLRGLCTTQTENDDLRLHRSCHLPTLRCMVTSFLLVFRVNSTHGRHRIVAAHSYSHLATCHVGSILSPDSACCPDILSDCDAPSAVTCRRRRRWCSSARRCRTRCWR